MINFESVLQKEESLDPDNWDHYRLLAHQMIDDIFAFLSHLGSEKVWVKPPQEVKNSFDHPVPEHGKEIDSIYASFTKNILPYRKGSIHPRYFSWVEGTGTITGVLADMLSSAMNSNLGIGDHSAIYVERQVINWCKQMVGFPLSSSGSVVSGGSIANITALVVARNACQEGVIKKQGLWAQEVQLVMYCSTETHNCLFKAAEIIGIGADYIRQIPVNEHYEINISLLEDQIKKDRESGFLPFCIVGNAGTVNTGAIDALELLADLCRKESIWFHVDGAIGALVNLVEEYQPRLKGMERADSIAFDLHKWLYINYEAGCVLIKDAHIHKNAFLQQSNYLLRHERGLSAGPESFSNYGLELSRNFKSLKVWMSIQEHGINKYARLIKQNIAQAFYMQDKILTNLKLEMLTSVSLNIVCYRFNPGNLNSNRLNHINKEILMRMQEQGIAAPSYTILKNQYAIRLSITNHRTTKIDLDKVISATIEIGETIMKENEVVKPEFL
ncbi:MAG: aspartate aminotransferase family protein [Flavisolibacter sp.]